MSSKTMVEGASAQEQIHAKLKALLVGLEADKNPPLALFYVEDGKILFASNVDEASSGLQRDFAASMQNMGAELLATGWGPAYE